MFHIGRIWQSLHGMDARPLIYPEKKLCLFFTAKAGCTFAAKWFFYQMELLDEALAYHHWIHKYRQDIHYKSDSYRKELKNIYSHEYTRIKLVRSPYQRAVSSYIHAVKRDHILNEISGYLDRPITDEKRFSFEEFISFLEATGVQNCNPHNRVQVLPEERKNKLSFDYVVKLENSMQEFRKIEQELGLKETNLENLAESPHHRNKIKSDIYNGDKISGKWDKQYYEFSSYFDEALKKRVAALYACDFVQYDYDINEI